MVALLHSDRSKATMLRTRGVRGRGRAVVAVGFRVAHQGTSQPGSRPVSTSASRTRPTIVAAQSSLRASRRAAVTAESESGDVGSLMAEEIRSLKAPSGRDGVKAGYLRRGRPNATPQDVTARAAEGDQRQN